eukprot:SAG11_NODE_575_length_8420_cov_2.398149_9_plen_83_part_00
MKHRLVDELKNDINHIVITCECHSRMRLPTQNSGGDDDNDAGLRCLFVVLRGMGSCCDADTFFHRQHFAELTCRFCTVSHVT